MSVRDPFLAEREGQRVQGVRSLFTLQATVPVNMVIPEHRSILSLSTVGYGPNPLLLLPWKSPPKEFERAGVIAQQ